MCFSKGLPALQQALNDGALPHKTLGFIPTAGDTYENQYFVEESRKRLKLYNIKLINLYAAKETQEELLTKLNSVDGICIASGNRTFCCTS